MEDGLSFISLAAQALAQDEFTKCFEPKGNSYPSSPLTIGYILWGIGVFIRYFILFPIRLFILSTGFGLFFVGLFWSIFFLPFCCGSSKGSSSSSSASASSETLQKYLFLFLCKVFVFSWFGIVRHHGSKPKLVNRPHLFVANHTSFIDFLILSSHEYCHATIAQTHGGLFGMLQKYVLALNGSIAFQRNERKDRLAVSKKINSHIRNPNKAPLLIFPEGTCVNNEYTVLFHKGAFELGSEVEICPVAIK